MSKKRMLALVLAAVLSLSSATVALADGESTAPETETTTTSEPADETSTDAPAEPQQPVEEENKTPESEEPATEEKDPEEQAPADDNGAVTGAGDASAISAATNAVMLDEPAELAGGNISSADALKTALATGGSYIVTSGFTVTEDLTATASDITIDFGSQTVTLSSGATLTVNNGAGLVLTGTEGGITKTDADNMITVNNGGSLEINGGVYENTANASGDRVIINYGTLTVNDGTISCGYDQAIHTQHNNEFSRVTECTINGGTVSGGGWGLVVFGAGNFQNDESILTVTGGTIKAAHAEAGQALSTNASGGIYSGFTINLEGGTIECEGTYGIGMYLSGNGETYVGPDVTITGKLAGIRAASGKLEIDGATIKCNSPHVETALQGNGPTGKNGAIVIGKGGTGYVGDIDVEIRNATIENASGDSLVVSDENMGKEELKGVSISVEIDQSDFVGNIEVMTLEPNSNDNDGTNVSLNIANTDIDGDVSVESEKTKVSFEGVTSMKTLTVTSNNNEVTVESTVQHEGDLPTNVTEIIVAPSTPVAPSDNSDNDDGGDYFGNETWDEVKDQIAEAEEGDTIKVSATGLPYFPSSVARALKGKDITLEIRKNGVTYEVNGLEIGDIDKIWYEFDELETELLTADADSEAPAAEDEDKTNPDTGR